MRWEDYVIGIVAFVVPGAVYFLLWFFKGLSEYKRTRSSEVFQENLTAAELAELAEQTAAIGHGIPAGVGFAGWSAVVMAGFLACNWIGLLVPMLEFLSGNDGLNFFVVPLGILIFILVARKFSH